MVLCLTLCISFFGGLSVYASDSAYYDDEVYEAMDVLRLFSIIPDYYDYNTDLTAKVSRADFAAAVAKAVNLTEYSGKPFFYDVSELHWAYNEISVLTNCGILSGVGDNLFKPDNDILKTEAYKIILSVIGYHDWAEYNGGFPIGYIKAAQRSDISDGVSDSETLTVGDMLLILYHALNTKVLEAVSFSEDGPSSYSTKNNSTILSLYRDLYYETGDLVGANGFTFDGDYLDSGKVKIDDNLYETDLNLTEYLGETVRFYYEQKSNSNTKHLIWIKRDSESSGNVLNIDVDYDAAFDADNFTLKYIDSNGKEKSASIAKGANVIYNGCVTGENLSEILGKPKYAAKLIRSSGGKYTTVIVRCFDNYYVGSINTNNQSIAESGSGLMTRELNLDEKDYDYISFSLYGTPKSFGDIKIGNILSVYKSLDGKYIEVHIVTETVEGSVDLISEQNEGKYLTINGKEYFLPNTAHGEEVGVGKQVKAYLDENGDIAYILRGFASFNPAYIFKLLLNNGAFGTEVKFKVLDSSGKIQTLKAASKVTIDGEKYQSAKDIYNKLLVNGEFSPMFVLINVTSNGEITMIDTSNYGVGGENDVLKTQVSYRTDVAYNNKSLENYGVLNDNTVIFFVPTDDSIDDVSESFFRIGKRTNLTNWVYYNFESYSTSERTGCEQFVVIKGADQPSEKNRTDHLPILVKSFGITKNYDGEKTYMLHGYRGPEEVKMVLGVGVYESIFDGKIKAGDIIRIAQDANGELWLAEKVFDIENPTLNITVYNSTYGESKGYVYDVTDNIIRITKTPAEYSTLNGRTIYVDNVPCIIYDKTEDGDNRFYYGNVYQAHTYIDFGEDCSMIYEMQTKGIPKMFVIYLYQ